MDASTNVVFVDQDSLVVKPNALAIADDDDSDEEMDEGNLVIDMNGSKDEEGEDVHRKSGSNSSKFIFNQLFLLLLQWAIPEGLQT